MDKTYTFHKETVKIFPIPKPYQKFSLKILVTNLSHEPCHPKPKFLRQNPLRLRELNLKFLKLENF